MRPIAGRAKFTPARSIEICRGVCFARRIPSIPKRKPNKANELAKSHVETWYGGSKGRSWPVLKIISYGPESAYNPKKVINMIDTLNQLPQVNLRKTTDVMNAEASKSQETPSKSCIATQPPVSVNELEIKNKSKHLRIDISIQPHNSKVTFCYGFKNEFTYSFFRSLYGCN